MGRGTHISGPLGVGDAVLKLGLDAIEDAIEDDTENTVCDTLNEVLAALREAGIIKESEQD